eukprot:766462-Hanusia_phi.AAC.7
MRVPTVELTTRVAEDNQSGEEVQQAAVTYSEADISQASYKISKCARGHRCRRRVKALMAGRLRLADLDTTDGRRDRPEAGGPTSRRCRCSVDDNHEQGMAMACWREFDSLVLQDVITSLGIVQSYEGEVDKLGRWHGTGTACLTNGVVYKGTFLHGDMHGSGEMEWPSGLKYHGEIEKNMATGKGKLEWPNGDYYLGSVKEGKRHGSGEFFVMSSNGEARSHYHGGWYEGKRHGWGKLTFGHRQDQWYEGEWKDGAKNGNGTMQWSSGNVYVGDFVNNCREGQGRMQWMERNEIYIGEWKADKLHGMGRYLWLSDVDVNKNLAAFNQYVGQFAENQRHGFGIFSYADGSRYVGEWNANHKHGKGTMISSVGVQQFATFVEGHAVSDSSPDGFVIKHENREHSIRLQLEDLSDSLQDIAREVTGVKKLLFSYLSELRIVFNFFSELEEESNGSDFDDDVESKNQLARNPLAEEFLARQKRQLAELYAVSGKEITLRQIWTFLESCGLIDANLSLAEADRVLLKVKHSFDMAFGFTSMQIPKLEDLKQTGVNVQLAHRADRKFVFSEFLESIVRISHFKYPEIASLNDRLSFCLFRNVFPVAARLAGRFASVSIKKTVFSKSDDFFASLYRRFASASPLGDLVLTSQGFLTLLDTYGMLNEKITCLLVLKSVCSYLIPDPKEAEANSFNLELEMLEHQFLLLLARYPSFTAQSDEDHERNLESLKQSFLEYQKGLNAVSEAEHFAALQDDNAMEAALLEAQSIFAAIGSDTLLQASKEVATRMESLTQSLQLSKEKKAAEQSEEQQEQQDDS